MCEASVFLLNLARKIISIGFLYRWQELIGAFMGTLLPLLSGLLAYFIKRELDKKEKRKDTIQIVEISITQSINHGVLSIIQLEAFLDRVNGKISEIQVINDEISYFPGSTNFPPITNISFNNDILKPGLRSYYLHNKFMSIEHIIRFTNCAVRKFDSDYSNLLSRNEVNMQRLKPVEQRGQYIKDLSSYSSMIEKVVEDFKKIGFELLCQAKIYNLKLMDDFKGTKKKYESGTMDGLKIKEIDKSIEIEVHVMLGGMELIK